MILTLPNFIYNYSRWNREQQQSRYPDPTDRNPMNILISNDCHQSNLSFLAFFHFLFLKQFKNCRIGSTAFAIDVLNKVILLFQN